MKSRLASGAIRRVDLEYNTNLTDVHASPSSCRVCDRLHKAPIYCPQMLLWLRWRANELKKVSVCLFRVTFTHSVLTWNHITYKYKSWRSPNPSSSQRPYAAHQANPLSLASNQVLNQNNIVIHHAKIEHFAKNNPPGCSVERARTSAVGPSSEKRSIKHGGGNKDPRKVKHLVFTLQKHGVEVNWAHLLALASYAG